ncbi:hypothetical protein NP493_256g04039 [Ridgeia piscesae]|uniref:Uncharacterized protein n=1 Tax=Ridgeia piscesae TaxID=27915 RepID=A0AAD9J2X8_RIDPI|nr:hypothetical protein NP493_3885g00000 [Ridgeia piscesae]KAK2184708.1 hypothetical protein NP493_256g04039 [Ridgeia piscesae]
MCAQRKLLEVVLCVHRQMSFVKRMWQIESPLVKIRIVPAQEVARKFPEVTSLSSVPHSASGRVSYVKSSLDILAQAYTQCTLHDVYAGVRLMRKPCVQYCD